MKQFHRFTLYILNFTLLFAAVISGAAKASPLATQDWTRRTFYDAIQETGRTNVLTAADRQMISNYVDEVCRLYAGTTHEIATNEVVFADGNILYTVGSTVQTNEVTFGFRAYTNAGMRVVASTLVEVPAGTLFAYDRATKRYLNGSATPPALAAAWVYSLTTSMVTRTSAAGRYVVTNIATRCFMKLSAESAAAEWYSQQLESTWIVHKLVDGARAGSFTIVPQRLSDAERDACLVGAPAAETARCTSFFELLVPRAMADAVYDEPPGSENAGDFLLSVKIGDLYYEVIIPNIQPVRPIAPVDSGGSYYNGPKQFVPCPWESLADWCNPVNRWGESISIAIPFDTAGGTIDYVQKSMSPRRLAANFPELTSQLAALYVYPVELVKVEPCAKLNHGLSGHNWGTDELGCYCLVCGTVRDCVFGNLNGDTTKCQTCLNYLGFEYEDGEPITHNPLTDERCGRVSPDIDRHVGWHQGDRVVNDMSSSLYWLYQCTCQCGYFGVDNGNPHDFAATPEEAEWEAGEDENGTNAELYHHAEIQCRRTANGLQCDGYMVVKELHDCVGEDGTVTAGSRVFPIKVSNGETVECQPDDPAANRTYHGQLGVCSKCLEEVSNPAMHAPDPDNGCLCPCGMTLHSVAVEPDDCGNYRCTNCGEFVRSEHPDEDVEKHYGYNAKDNDAANHWCNCGRTSEPHEEYVKVAADGSRYCERCGYEFPDAAGGDNNVERYRVRYYPNRDGGGGSGISVWGSGGGGTNSVNGEVRGTLPPGIDVADLKKSTPSEADTAIRARGWTLKRIRYSTRRYWYNLWLKTDVWVYVYEVTNAQGKKVEFEYTYDLGLTFWEDSL